ncbi:MAG: universal stress protein [Dehalococcoidia bacterium]
MDRILVPLDGSPLAEAVLPHAKDLALGLSATIYLVRVVPLARQLAAASFAGSGGIEGVSALDITAIDEAVALQMQDARTYLEEQAGALTAEGIAVEWEVRQGTTVEEIIQSAQASNIDIIAISSHGRSGLGRLVFGSVCDRVMRESGLPLLVIKPSRKDISSGAADE